MDVLGNGAVLLMRLMLENENSLVVAVVVADCLKRLKLARSQVIIRERGGALSCDPTS